jgi:hypothetical protein
VGQLTIRESLAVRVAYCVVQTALRVGQLLVGAPLSGAVTVKPIRGFSHAGDGGIPGAFGLSEPPPRPG